MVECSTAHSSWHSFFAPGALLRFYEKNVLFYATSRLCSVILITTEQRAHVVSHDASPGSSAAGASTPQNRRLAPRTPSLFGLVCRERHSHALALEQGVVNAQCAARAPPSAPGEVQRNKPLPLGDSWEALPHLFRLEDPMLDRTVFLVVYEQNLC